MRRSNVCEMFLNSGTTEYNIYRPNEMSVKPLQIQDLQRILRIREMSTNLTKRTLKCFENIQSFKGDIFLFPNKD